MLQQRRYVSTEELPVMGWRFARLVGRVEDGHSSVEHTLVRFRWRAVAAAVSRKVHNHAPGVHPRHGIRRDQLWCRFAGNGGRRDDDVALADNFRQQLPLLAVELLAL